MFNSLKLNSAKERLLEEKLFEQVALEIQQGHKRSGLWAKAISLSKGHEELAKAKYIELRVQSLKDEIAVTHEVLERESKSVKKVVFTGQTDNGWYLVCDVNDSETIQLIKRAKKRKANHNQLKSLCSKMGLKAKGKVGFFKDSWHIEDQKGKNIRYDDSDNLEVFLVRLYESLV